MLVAGDSTNVTTYFALRLTADGKAATGLTITGIDLQYVRSGATPAAKVDATALAATDSAHADNKAIEIDATDQPGLYRVDWPDAAFAAGVREVILSVKVATAFTEHLRVEIDGEVNVVEWAGTDVVAGAIPAVAADGAGGLPISDAGGLDLDAKLAATNEVTAARMGALTDWINGGRLDLLIDAILADTAVIGALGAGLTGIPWNAAWDAEVQSEVADALAAYDPPTRAEATSDKDELAAFVNDEVALILEDTGTTLPATLSTMEGKIDTLDGVADAIKVITDQMVFTVANLLDGNMLAISGDTGAADKLEEGATTLVLGAAVGTPTTTVIDTDLTEATTDHYKGRILTFTSGNIAGQSTDITGYNGTTKELTVTALTDAPAATDTFVIS